MPVNSFTWSEQKQSIAVWSSAAPTIAGLVIVLIVLILAGFIHANPRTRSSLRRQSLRMLLCVQIASLIYSGTHLGQLFITGRTVWCSVCTTLVTFTSNFTGFVIMLIPVNLQVTLVHGIRTEGWVRYYLGGSLLVATVIAVPGAAKNVWGWDPLMEACGIKTPDPTVRHAWMIGAAYAWFLLSMVVTTISTLAVVMHLITYTHSNDRKLLGIRAIRSSSFSNERMLRAVAWRITLYPAVLIVCSGIGAASYFMINDDDGISSQPRFVIWVAGAFCSGALPMAYGLVVLFVDPSFSRAVRDLLRAHPSITSSSRRQTSVELGGGLHHPLMIEFSQRIATLTDRGSVVESSTPPVYPPAVVTAKHLGFSDARGGKTKQAWEPAHEVEGLDGREQYLSKGVEFVVAPPVAHDDANEAASTSLVREVLEEATVQRHATHAEWRADLDQL